MADVTNELIYGVLQKLQEDVAATRHEVREIKSELTAIRGHIYAEHQDISNIYSMLARHDQRLERIERRLDLVTEPAI